MIRTEMWRRVLVLCCVLSGLFPARGDAVESDSKIPLSGAVGKEEQDAPPGAKAGQSARGGERLFAGTTQETTAEPLEEELNNQENVLSQLLGDYDKVKIVSSGSDCVCRCVVRPIKRSECNRVSDASPTQPPRDFYTLETITTGTDCRQCMCTAPPSAVNPCEGEYRLKKLQEASKDDIKLATIIDLLEGSLYGMDLLKLNSVNNKLLGRVDNIEKTFSRSFTDRVKEHAKERVKEKEKEKKAQVKKKKVNDSERKNGAAAVNNKQKNLEERSTGSQRKKNQTQDSVEQKQPTRKKTASQKPIKDKAEPKQPIKDKNSLVVKGVSFYKADGEPDKEEEQQRAWGANTTLTDASENILVSDQLPPTGTFHIHSPGLSTAATTKPTTRGPNSRTTGWTQKLSAPTQTSALTTTTKPDPATTHPTNKPTTNLPPTTTSITTTNKLTTPHQTTTTTTATTTTQPTTFTTQYSTSFPPTNVAPPIVESPTPTAFHPGPKSRLSWTESPADQLKTTKKPAVCKDTVASISEPIQKNSYGKSDGAWMRDARGHGNVIYLTNGDYGNNLLEFRDMSTFISGQISNSYKLPYSFTGTGHVVFNGAFFYNRAFSRDIIRYDLRHRYVTAWTTLHNAVLEEQAQRTRTEVEFAVDESGLWLLYPALDTEGFHQEVILLTQLHPRDLLPINSFRTGLRWGLYGNAFLVCGVLYGVNSMDRHYANVTYAFDTHTLTHTVPSLAFTNTHAHTSQLAYCPLDKKLYAWDNGHQMMYDVIFAY